MDRRSLLAVCALLLCGLALGGRTLAGRDRPAPREATSLLAAQSLWADHDLRLEARDVARGFAAWDSGPRGLALTSPDGGRTLLFAPALPWALVAAPFVGLLGPGGIYLLDALLLLGIAVLLARRAGEDEPALGLAFLLLLGSALAGYGLRLGPELLRAALLLAAFSLWLRESERSEEDGALPSRGALTIGALLPRGALAIGALLPRGALAIGALLALAFVIQPLDGLLLLAPLADLLLRRRMRALGGLLAGALLVLFASALATRALTGAWALDTGDGGALARLEVRVSAEAPPGDPPGDLWERAAAPRAAGGWSLAGTARSLGGLAVGRTGGLLPYFPFALWALVLFFVAPKERSRNLLAAALALWLVAAAGAALAEPRSGLGSPLLAGVYPLFLLLVPRGRWRWRSVVLPSALAALWALPAVAAALAGRPAPPALGLLPLEIGRLQASVLGRESLGLGLPGYRGRVFGEAVWWVPEESFFVEEKHPRGVWVRGDSRSEVVIVVPGAAERLAFTVTSLAAGSELVLDAGAGSVRVRFDSEGKRQGVPIELPVTPRARDRGGFFPRESYVRLRLDVRGGAVPARLDARSRDRRYLGVFLDFTGQGR